MKFSFLLQYQTEIMAYLTEAFLPTKAATFISVTLVLFSFKVPTHLSVSGEDRVDGTQRQGQFWQPLRC